MGSLTQAIPKALVYVAGKTLLEWSIERLESAGCKNVIIALGYKSKLIRESLDTTKYVIDIHLVEVPNYQHGPLQTFVTATTMVKGNTAIVNPVDLIIAVNDVKAILSSHPKQNPDAVILAIDQTGIRGSPVSIDSDDMVLVIHEGDTNKSTTTRSAMLLTFSKGFIAHCNAELQNGQQKVVSALNSFIKLGKPIHSHVVTENWFDIDTIQDLLETNGHLLETSYRPGPESIFIPSGDIMEVSDRLSLGHGIELGKEVLLKGPCLIKQDSEIGDNCVIGPYVCIAEKTSIGSHSELRNAIIFGTSVIKPCSRIIDVVVFHSKEYQSED